MDKFWNKVDKTSNDCWQWLGCILNSGYGQYRCHPSPLHVAQTRVQAHRFAYEAWRGTIPQGLELDHLCRYRQCVNPWHLEPVTRQENQRRAGEYKRLNPR